MEETLNQPSRVQEDGSMGCKLLLEGKKFLHLCEVDGTFRISTG